MQVGTSLLMSWQFKKQNSSGSFYIVMANLHCQLVWIWNHFEDISLGMSMRAFLERINVEEKTHPKVCGITPWTRDLDSVNKPKERQMGTNQLSTFRFLIQPNVRKWPYAPMAMPLPSQ